jgi:hypothetical protein
MRILFVLAFFLFLFGCLTEECPTDYDPVCTEDGTTYPNSCMAERSGASVVYNGTCDELSCEDSDSGSDVMELGIVQSKGTILYDKCFNSTAVLEYFCRGGVLINKSIPCPDGHVCSGGICLEGQIGESDDEQPITCTDSDGRDFSAKGILVYGDDTFTDRCVGTRLIEYFCSDEMLQSEMHACADGCIDGACVSQRCTDTEEGRTIYSAGTVNLINEGEWFSYPDSCAGESMVTEYSCNGSALLAVNITCPEGYSCGGGTCYPGERCHDTDAGKGDGRYTRGKVYTMDDVHADHCDSDGRLVEYSCTEHGLVESFIDCPDGFECSGAKCTKVTECTETDDGKDFDARGVTKEPSGFSAEDECIDSASLFEYFCGPDELVSSVRHVCTPGKACSDGACVESEDCTDSDGGVDYFLTGLTEIGNITLEEDSCENNTLTEFYCDEDGRIASISYSCPFGYSCAGGACISTCSETDDGNNPSEFGQLRYGSRVFADYCEENMLVEYSCSDDGLIYNSNTYECHSCSEGVCSE